MAQKIPQDVISDIQQQVSIVDVISRYVQLKKQGVNYFGLCPFQTEKTPSFSVNENKKIFHCFSCGRGGSVFSFVMMIENLNFVEAVSKVAEFGGITFNSFRYQSNFKENINQPVEKVLKFAQDFYSHILQHTEIGKKALDYLVQRKIQSKTIEHFKIGYAPENNLLTKALFQNSDLSSEAIRKSGVLNESESSQYDYFKDRLMVPIDNPNGHIVGFGGRSFKSKEKTEPRYLNSKQSDIFNKSDLLFNLNAAKQEISQAHEVVLMEGYFDVISAWQAGVKNVVATMGTSLTNRQIGLLNKVTSRVILVYDGDRAGKSAIDKAIDSLNSHRSLDVMVAPLPGNLDPDDYIKKYGSESFKKLVNKDRISKYRFRLDYYQEKLDLNKEQDLLTFVDEILDKFTDLKDDPIQKEIYLKELSQLTGISLLNLQNQFNLHVTNKTNANNKISIPLFSPKKSEVDSRADKAQKELLFLIFNNNLFNWLKQNYQWFFPNTDYQIIYQLFDQYYHENQGKVHFYEFINELPIELANIATAVNSLNRPTKTDKNEVRDLIKVIRNTELKNKILDKQHEIDEYQKLGQKEKLNQSIKELMELIRLRQQEVS